MRSRRAFCPTITFRISAEKGLDERSLASNKLVDGLDIGRHALSVLSQDDGRPPETSPPRTLMNILDGC